MSGSCVFQLRRHGEAAGEMLTSSLGLVSVCPECILEPRAIRTDSRNKAPNDLMPRSRIGHFLFTNFDDTMIVALLVGRRGRDQYDVESETFSLGCLLVRETFWHPLGDVIDGLYLLSVDFGTVQEVDVPRLQCTCFVSYCRLCTV